MTSTTLSVDAGARTALLHETIGANLAATVARFGGAEALVSRHQGLRYTYRQLWDEVERVARGLLALGIDRGDRVGIWSPNGAEWTLLQFATARIGAILVNVNPAYRPAELAYALRQSGVRLLVTAERFKTSEYLGEVVAVRTSHRRCHERRHRVVRHSGDRRNLSASARRRVALGANGQGNNRCWWS